MVIDGRFSVGVVAMRTTTRAHIFFSFLPPGDSAAALPPARSRNLSLSHCWRSVFVLLVLETSCTDPAKKLSAAVNGFCKRTEEAGASTKKVNDARRRSLRGFRSPQEEEAAAAVDTFVAKHLG